MKRNRIARGAQLGLLSVALTCTDELVPTAPDERVGGAASAVQFATSATDPSVIVWDTFSRTVTSGWGTADAGGAWYTQTAGSIFRVDGARGVITVPDTRSYNVVGIGPVHGTPGMPGYGLDVGGLLAFQFDRMPDGETSRHNIYVYARRNDRLVDGANTYLFRVRPSRTGLELRIDKTVNNSTSSLISTLTVKGTVDVATRWWIRWEVFGVSPATTARLRVWKEGTPEPTVWHRSVVVNEPALDQSGSTGVRFAAASNQLTFPVSLFIDDLQYTRLGDEPPPNQTPVAAAGGPYAGTPGAAVAFDGRTSSDPDNNLPLTYAWTFGDGATATGATPTHTYSATGTYHVTLRVTDANGLTSAVDSTTATISAAPNTPPVANAGGPYSTTLGNAVLFDGSASADADGDLPLTYAWNFGDGSHASGATPSHTYAAQGNYTVTLTVTDARGLGSATVSTTANITPRPNQAPVANPGGPYSGVAGSAVQLNGSASSDPDVDLPLTYAWNFGDGTTGTGATPSHTYAAEGNYTVTLTVTDARGLASAPVSTTAAIAPRPNQAPIANPGGPYNGVPGGAVQLNGSASSDPDGNVPLTYAWNFGDGTTGTGATPSHVYATGGTYNVTLTVTDTKGLSSSPASTTVVISSLLKGDTFSRFLSQGWGSAEVGGGWYAQPSSTFSVDGSRGVLTSINSTTKNVVGVGPVHGASSMPGYGLNVGGLVSYRIDRIPDGSTSKYVLQVYARRNDRVTDGDNYYRFRVRVSRTAIEMRIEKNVNGASLAVTDVTSISAAFDPNAKWWLRWEAFGTSPATTLRMRVWKDGTPEPTTWHRSAVINEPGLDLSGTTGVRFQVPSDQVNYPVRLYIDDLQYTSRNP